MNRRNFLAAAAAGTLSLRAYGQTPATSKQRSPLCVFTKPFNSLSSDELAGHVSELGFDGIEAPIRSGGHVDPSEVEEKLPALVESLRNRGLTVTVMTSDINSADDPHTENVLRVAAELGIKRYRLKYLRYDEHRPIRQQLANWTSQLRDLAAMNGELGIRGLYQNHAGQKYFGAVLWDLADVLESVAPRQDQLGVAYDIRHATVEGGMSWPTTWKLIRPYVDTLYVKDFVWTATGVKNVPLGTGRIDPDFIRGLRSTGFHGPISLHEEYLDHRDPSLVDQHLAAIKRDFDRLRSWLSS